MYKRFSLFLTLMVVTFAMTSCSSDDDGIQTSSLAEITDFSLEFKDLDAENVRYKLGSNITVSVPYGTSLNEVVPTISVSDNATVTPKSGVALDFVSGEAKSFVVTAEDGTTKEYTVTITVRPEVGSGSKLAKYTISDDWGGVSTTTYSYTEANFVDQMEFEEWGETTTTVFEYNADNQIVGKTMTLGDDVTKYVYSYDNGQIVKAVSHKNNDLFETIEYTYSNEDLSVQKRTNHLDNDKQDVVEFEIVNGNVVKEVRYGDEYTASEYDEKNNPFIGLYPAAYAAISVGIEFGNTNNPISYSKTDDGITYDYNTDGYPVHSSYTYFGMAEVVKTYIYN